MKLQDRYNVAVPRYTSYPPANYFESNPVESYLRVLDSSSSEGEKSISLYFHIPFCRHLCHYCGCNSHALPVDDTFDRYMRALHREIGMVIERLDRSRQISQIHFGGGTPTLLPAERLGEIIDRFRGEFDFASGAEIAIECHPAYIDREYWLALASVGFNRISIGVQDLKADVLDCVNRKRPLMELGEIVPLLHSVGVKVNVDLIYGLPLQSVESFAETLERVAEVAPDRIVTFSYAHVPWVNHRQLELERVGLPSAELKSEIYDRAKQVLTHHGYISLGLDHFVKEDDELAVAIATGRLHRNFQGYTTRATTGQVYAFGASAISQLTAAFYQNDKSIEGYIARIEKGEFAFDKGYLLTYQEQVISDVIATLMCNRKVEWATVATRWGISQERLLDIVEYDEARFASLIEDGIITLSGGGITVTELGAKYIRNVAAALDPLMKSSTKNFSKSL